MKLTNRPLGPRAVCRGWRLAYVLIATMVALSTPVRAAVITRGPILQNPAALTTTVTISWWTDVVGDSTVEYGLTTGLGASVTVGTAGSCEIGSAGTCHTVPLTGLLPGTRYYYQLKTNGSIVQGVSSNIYFTTFKEPADPSDVFFTVIGDWGEGSAVEQQVSNHQNTADPQIILTVGDNAYETGLLSEWDSKALAYYVNPMMRAFFIPALGNHDLYDVGESNWANSAEIKLFVLPHNGPEGERYFSFDNGDAHFIVLDSNDPGNSTQINWLQNDLATTARKWIFVFLHHTPYSCANGIASIGSDLSVRNNWGPLFEQYEVDIVFVGHDHIYERTNYLDDFGSDGKGTIYIMTGGGGAPLDSIAKVDGSGNAYRQPFEPFGSRTYCTWLAHNCPPGPSNYCSIGRFHHTAARITGNTTLSLQAIDSNNVVFDTLSIVKGDPTPTPTSTPTSTPLPSPTPTVTATATPTHTPTRTATPTPLTECTGTTATNQCIPGGGGSVRSCNLEWIVPSAPVFLKNGIRTNKVYCRDGAAVCDFDASAGNQSCTFHVTWCINNTDPRLTKCLAPDIASIEVKRPKPISTDPADIANLMVLENQAGGGGFGVSVVRDGTTVFTGTSNVTPNLCSAPLNIVVPRPIGGRGVGKKTLRIRGTTSAGKRFSDTLRLECSPPL